MIDTVFHFSALRYNALAHPSFDSNLPRRAVFVTTGRLVGGAPIAAQEYSRHLSELHELQFITWDKEIIISLISKNIEIGLAGNYDNKLILLIGKIHNKEVNSIEVEQFSRKWCVTTSPIPNVWRIAFEAAIIANLFRQNNRLDLACYTVLCLIRAVWVNSHGTEPPNSASLSVADLGKALFCHYAEDLWKLCDEDSLQQSKFIQADEIPTAYVTYPVRCLQLMEFLGLFGLCKTTGDTESSKLAKYIIQFFENHPGTTHPISDRWAVSIVPPVLFLCKLGYRDRVEPVLKDLIRWIGNRYENESLGLASPLSSPDEEINYFLGTPFEHINLQRRSESYVSTIILDLAAILEMKDVYEIGRNDFLAVGAMSCVIEVKDTVGQYLLDANDLSYEPNIRFDEIWNPVDEWKSAPHHKRGPEWYYLEKMKRFWDHLVVSSVLRDRHFVRTCRKILTL